MTVRKHKSNLFTATVLAIALSLAGCVSTGSNLLGASADTRLTQGDEAQFFSTSGAVACGGAAMVAALACAASNSSDKAKCALLAGATACTVGMGANYLLDQRRAKYSNTSTRLTEISNDIQAETMKVQQRTATAQQVIDDDKRKLAEIEAGIKKNSLDQQAARTDLARVDANIKRLREEILGMNKIIGEFREIAATEQTQSNTAKTKNLDKEIDTMNKRVIALQNEVDSLYSQRSAITLG